MGVGCYFQHQNKKKLQTFIQIFAHSTSTNYATVADDDLKIADLISLIKWLEILSDSSCLTLS